MSSVKAEVTAILGRIETGDSKAVDDLWPMVYDELRRLATHRLQQERNRALDSTELVHEAFLKLVDVAELRHWTSRRHFYATAGEAMRQILIDIARRRAAQKRGANANRVSLEVDLIAGETRSQDVLALDEAISELERHDPLSASLVKLRFFGGMRHQEAAEAIGISRREADRRWVTARTWLYKMVTDGRRPTDSSKPCH